MAYSNWTLESVVPTFQIEKIDTEFCLFSYRTSFSHAHSRLLFSPTTTIQVTDLVKILVSIMLLLK